MYIVILTNLCGWNWLYTVLTLKYGVNLLNASVSCVLRQNARAILTATACKRVFPLRYSDTRSSTFAITHIQKYRFLLLWNVSVQMWFMYTSWYFYSILQGQQSIQYGHFDPTGRVNHIQWNNMILQCLQISFSPFVSDNLYLISTNM